MAPSVAVRAVGVGKRYWRLEERPLLLRSLLPLARPVRHELWALRDLDLTVARGETVGVLGRNGAGKTTLLRLLAGVTRPTEGRVEVAGRVAPLISVGVGFHREMTGRENVYVNGMLLGLSRAEVEERFEAIVRFAELGEFIDTPVKFYSSGMFMRLGFAVAVHTDPDLLLVDEVLAVGDLAFQRKCFDHMRALQEAGTTVVVVSHSLHAIRMLCPRAVVLSSGRLVFDGDVDRAIAEHLALLPDADEAGADPHELRVTGGVELVRDELCGPSVNGGGGPLVYRMVVRFSRPVSQPVFNVSVVADDGLIAYGLRTPLGSGRDFEAGEVAEVVAELEPNLGEGAYQVVAAVHSATAREYLLVNHGPRFYVAAGPCTYGRANLRGRLLVNDDCVVDGHGEVLR